MSDEKESEFGRRLIPFYGGKHPELFEIERRCMDRPGKVIRHLDEILPAGLVLDIGAGNGFTAQRLQRPGRTVIPMEPDPLMVDHMRPLIWANGVAQQIPFHDRTFDAAYATWAFFFRGIADLLDGLREAARVVRPGGLLAIADNAGGDEFCGLATRDIAADRAWWTAHGFRETLIHTRFEFDTLMEATRLLAFYFGQEAAARNRKTVLGYDVVVYTVRVDQSLPFLGRAPGAG